MEFPGISKSEHMEFGPSGAAQDAMVRAATTQKSCWKCLKVHESWQTPMVIVYYINILIYIYVPKVDNITNGYLFIQWIGVWEHLQDTSFFFMVFQ
jgi:hypothetical protein